VIRTVGNDLILTGGRPRGTLFAVYEFPENQLGCHWLDSKTTVTPSRPTLTIESLNVRAQPWLKLRMIGGGGLMSPRNTADPESYYLFAMRNKDLRYTKPEAGFFPVWGAPWGWTPHSFFSYIPGSLFATHPEYFTLDKQGVGKQAQLCMPHQEVRRLMLESLRKTIAKDREKAIQKGWPHPTLYMIGHMANRDCCRCPACAAIAEQEESYSGPLLDFLNALAAAIGPDYPDVRLVTLSYTFSSKAPKTMKARDNVMVIRGNLLGRDMLHPMTETSSAWQGWLDWGRKAGRLMLYDYWWRSCNDYLYWQARGSRPDVVHGGDRRPQTRVEREPDSAGPGLPSVQDRACGCPETDDRLGTRSAEPGWAVGPAGHGRRTGPRRESVGRLHLLESRRVELRPRLLTFCAVIDPVVRGSPPDLGWASIPAVHGVVFAQDCQAPGEGCRPEAERSRPAS